MRVNAVGFGEVEVLVAEVVHNGGVGVQVTAKDDAIHRVCLVVGTTRPPIFLRVKVADGEKVEAMCGCLQGCHGLA